LRLTELVAGVLAMLEEMNQNPWVDRARTVFMIKLWRGMNPTVVFANRG
jgi:hypothetical protein